MRNNRTIIVTFVIVLLALTLASLAFMVPGTGMTYGGGMMNGTWVNGMMGGTWTYGMMGGWVVFGALILVGVVLAIMGFLRRSGTA